MKPRNCPARQVYVEKRPGFDVEARGLKDDIAAFLGPQYPALAKLAELRILNGYYLSGAELNDEQFKKAVELVFSEPQCDRIFYELPEADGACFGVEYLPGQYDQRADSAEQCLELVLGLRPNVRCAKYYILVPGDLDQAGLAAVKSYLINPVDSREKARTEPAASEESAAPAEPAVTGIPGVTGFTGLDEKGLAALAAEYGLAMSPADLGFCRDYFASCGRDPTLTELRVLDTYWSDHCRHTTFTTVLEPIEIAAGSGSEKLRKALERYENARREVYGAVSRPRTLMDMATIGAKLLKKRGLLQDIDESKEINACTIKITAEFETARQSGASDVSNRETNGEPRILSEPWLLLFKNETHNHPTEIEPFGGAATCLGGAIRDPLSGRAYVHQAMRITGGGDPRGALAETLPGKLPQIKIARDAAAGYSSYGNQIGLATGQVAEFYHDGYLAKRLELGAVIGAVPESQVRRAAPEKGDVVLLIGGKTGRDGIGGATGSSKAHTGESVESAGAEVQKGNAVEERKLQRLFRRAEVSRLIKRCNDFGAGGVSVAVGELAPGLDINLDAVPKKYAGLDGTELAISESQERMAVVAAPEDSGALIRAAAMENLDAVVIAVVTCGDGEHSPDEARLRMSWRGKTIVDLSRNFLDANGAARTSPVTLRASVETADGRGAETAGRCGADSGERFPSDGAPAADRAPAPRRGGKGKPEASPEGAGTKGTATSPFQILERLEAELGSLRSGSRRGLQERFDGSIGAASVLFPWGGKTQGTPECGMAAFLPVLPGRECRTASLMSFGFDPERSRLDPYEGAKGAVKEALAKFACLGGDPFTARLSMQEYFERMETPESWGKPAAALLGALEAQLALGVPAIGGKDSMSGTYRDPARGVDIAVPPTLAVFAAGTTPAASVRSGALCGAPGHPVLLLYGGTAGGVSADGGSSTGDVSADGVLTGGVSADEWERFRANMAAVAELAGRGLVKAAYPVGSGGAAVALALMAFGNMTGLEVRAEALNVIDRFNYPGAVLLELDRGISDLNLPPGSLWVLAAETIARPVFRIGGAEKPLAELRKTFESVLDKVYPQTSGRPAAGAVNVMRYTSGGKDAKPAKRFYIAREEKGRPPVVLPVFPGTNCEWDMERAFLAAGARVRQVVFRNRNAEDIAESTKELAGAIAEARIMALSGGFSAGDEPDGSGKFIANVLRSPGIFGAVNDLLEKRDGLILGICNGFQALVKLGLVPYGRYTEAADGMPTLGFNRVGRHVSRMVRTTVMSNLSPWLALEEPGTLHIVPVSHGEGRFVVSEAEGKALFGAGQVPFCYADEQGRPVLTEPDNPNGSDFAVEGLTSPDGRILGKMAHSERCGRFVHVNIPGNKHQRIFEAGVAYFA
ncbi:MAG: phosphoribosylformylglycinamidine synthase subunit PurQ [Treponema sp.]|nr:phosphoribosylformylglycinamidine synthase subunit PurQ [Treponema sp.]